MLQPKIYIQVKHYLSLYCVTIILGLIAVTACSSKKAGDATPVEYVNPYIGNISHMLVPTYPTIHLPNSLLRVYPERGDFTGDRLHGLPLIVTSHRGNSAFNLSPFHGETMPSKPVIDYSYDQEIITPYSYYVYLEDENIDVDFAVSHQSAIYSFDFPDNSVSHLMFNSKKGNLNWDGRGLSGSQEIGNNTNVYIYAEPEYQPLNVETLNSNKAVLKAPDVTEGDACLILTFGERKNIKIKYGISFIDAQQAKANLTREIKKFGVSEVKNKGKAVWNEALGKIQISGGTESDKYVFYTSLYRTFERPVNISEDGRYFSGFDGKVHQDGGRSFYTDDWIWDSYRAHHPLNVLIDGDKEADILNSFVRMSEQMENFWLPTFPEINGDSRRMNSNHGVASLLDAYEKGIRAFDFEKAYQAAKGALTEKTLAPWSAMPAGKLDDFFKEKGYIPALYPDEKETVPEVHDFEKRQPVAVTLGTSYDLWCLAKMAKILGHTDDYELFIKQSFNYRNLFNHETKFFHPKDDKGKFIEPFDYIFSGGQGARAYYGENNAWIYRWDVQHNIEDLIKLMGGKDQFVKNLEDMFNKPLGKSKSSFYAQLPDHTGNVGQFSMANEPSLHIPYLYNYADQPWKTQKRIRALIHQWFRNDLMGVPGDEDGGGLSSFVVFSQMGFYPVTPGSPIYTIGSPFFEKSVVKLTNGKEFIIIANDVSARNKYIQSAKLNGKNLNEPWFAHSDIANGGLLELEMGPLPNKKWGRYL
ncbi:GH92 family glycosyl hydrolase [Sphingobacterium corticibacterium]|uniref:Glycoside hydrolase family 92 protein n=1 Tax=Sphingobacterium corticibacterium TaxID=2484746 RepID=A0A4Q6XR56_9SPHI|nr:GH92 family glycosyl hydrolase [Sphingobacterium corticibacterium]RZF58696.1 glycoside hydrolase family 92 protein [Sphingobacterium corticibacterium]